MFKALRMIGLSILGIIIIIVLVAFLFIKFSPQFGGKATDIQLSEYEKSGHFINGKFKNELDTPMDMDFIAVLKEKFKNGHKRQPSLNVEVEKIDSLDLVKNDSSRTKLTWFGHSTFLLEMDDKIILIDPMFGSVPAPHPWLGTNRYSKELPIAIEKLPFIDAVIFSHDHYDHLDYGSVQKLKHKVGSYYTPLGVGNHLTSWGIDQNKIHQLNWWDEIAFENIKLVCTPARHFSGRGVTDRFKTFWSSWVIKGSKHNIFFSGDSGYGYHFKEIGTKYGPFDISLMECGQYNEQWKNIHMMPEETAQAALDLGSKVMMPIHWGAFTLALHDWTDPVIRVSRKANELGIPITTPKIGEKLIVGDNSFPEEKWWLNYN